MTNKPTIALLGATGKAGAYLLKELLNSGYPVKALIRRPDAFTITHPLLHVIPGDIKDAAFATELLSGCEAVISAIGPRQGEPLIASLSTENILTAMEVYGIKRYIALAGLNVDVSSDKKGEATQAKTDWMRQNFPDAVADRQKAYEILAESKIDWTILRLPWIEQTNERRGIVVDLYDSPGEKISTTDLANFVISQIDNKMYVGKAPFLASR